MGICLWAGVSCAEGYSGPCVGGTIITANSYTHDVGGYCDEEQGNCNGYTFCVSNGAMTWWSGHLWCKANGGRLADFEIMCPGSPTSIDEARGACANLAGLGGSWQPYYSGLSLNNGSVLGIHMGTATDPKGDILSRSKAEANWMVCL